jgi:diguanylate cyclase (GGDEF)-like protein
MLKVMDDIERLDTLDLVDSIVTITEQRNIETLESVLAETVFETLNPREVATISLTDEETVVTALIRADDTPLPFDITLNDLAPEIREAIAEFLLLPKAERIPERMDDPPMIGACAIYPIVSRSRIAGVLCILPDAFSESDWRLASGLVRIYRNFVDLLNEKDHDRLTGLLNRSLLEAQIMQRLTLSRKLRDKPHTGDERRAPANAGRNWLAMIDIDHFKSINDNYGHLYGDEVLLLVSSLMHKTFRRIDQLYRFGGEEFVVLLLGIDEETANRVLERFRSAVQNFEFPQVGRVTVSIGYVEMFGQDLPTTVIGHADQALYYAKKNGRNQVSSYRQLVAEGKIVPSTVVGSVELFSA